VTIAAIDRLTLRVQQLHAAEAAVDCFAKEQLKLAGRLIEL
jgi:hypothetical protein